MQFENVIRYNSLPALADLVIDLSYQDYVNYNALPVWRSSIQVYDFDKFSIAPYGRLFIKTDKLYDCLDMLDQLTYPIHLLTGVSDLNPIKVPGVERILKNNNILSWVGNNLPKVNDRIMTVPIGFTEKSRGEDFFSFYGVKKKNKAILTPHGDTSASRNVTHSFLKNTNLHVDAIFDRLNKADYLNCLYNYRYSICLPGNGLDTHRVYESIAMQTIPIVMRSPISDLHQSLGAIVIDSLDELDENFFLHNASHSCANVRQIYFEEQKAKIFAFQKSFEN